MKNSRGELTNQVVKNYFWNFFMMFLGRFGGMIFIIIAARLLLPEEYGIYALATAVALFLISITNKGSNQTLSKYLSEDLGRNDKKLAAAHFKFLFRVKLLISFSSAIILFALAYPLTFLVFRKPGLLIPLFISAIYLICLSFQNFYEYAFYALKKVKYLTAKEAIFQLSKIVLIIVFLTLFAKKYSTSLIIFALILSSSIAILFLSFNLKREAKFIFQKPDKNIEKKGIIKFMSSVIFSNLSTIVFSYIDIITIGIFLAAEYSGYYSVSFAIIGGLYSFISMACILLPIFTQIKKENLSRAFNEVFKYLSMLSVPIIFGVAVLGGYVLRLAYGSEYLQATPALIILSLLVFEFPVTDALISLFYAGGFPKKVIRASVIATFLNIFLNVVLVLTFLTFSTEIWAMAGVSIATVISRLFILVTLSIEARKTLNIHYNLKLLLKPLFASLVMASLILLINFYVKDMTLLLGIFEIILGALVYFLVMILLKGITKEDFQLLKLLHPTNLIS